MSRTEELGEAEIQCTNMRQFGNEYNDREEKQISHLKGISFLKEAENTNCISALATGSKEIEGSFKQQNFIDSEFTKHLASVNIMLEAFDGTALLSLRDLFE